MDNIKKTLIRVLIQFLIMFILGYFWIENDIMKALKLSIWTILVINIFHFIEYFYRKKYVKSRN
ncbi:hypothetical protein [Clostridium cylindrosporum]|uniref:hypothetical protein n=1 Tax=Clostridium cylindrosporum TaxID=1495 RepID=UPI00065CAC07|nr:hypothetical protein [Clostridium cylindrosporum]